MVASLVGRVCVYLCVYVWGCPMEKLRAWLAASLFGQGRAAAFQGLRLANHAVERRLTNCALGTAACGNSEASSSAASMQNFVSILTHRQIQREPGAGALNRRHLHMEPQAHARRSTADAGVRDEKLSVE